jgi:hypothetical protein
MFPNTLSIIKSPSQLKCPNPSQCSRQLSTTRTIQIKAVRFSLKLAMKSVRYSPKYLVQNSSAMTGSRSCWRRPRREHLHTRQHQMNLHSKDHCDQLETGMTIIRIHESVKLYPVQTWIYYTGQQFELCNSAVIIHLPQDIIYQESEFQMNWQSDDVTWNHCQHSTKPQILCQQNIIVCTWCWWVVEWIYCQKVYHNDATAAHSTTTYWCESLMIWDQKLVHGKYSNNANIALTYWSSELSCEEVFEDSVQGWRGQ